MNKPGDVFERMKQMHDDPAYQAKLAEREQEQRAQYAAWLVEEHRQARVKIGIPARVLQLLDKPRETEAVKAVRALMLPNAPRCLLLLLGGTGCGKTVAACVGLAEAVRIEGKDPIFDVPRAYFLGLFVKAIQLVRAGTFEEEFWRKLEKAPVLVIDDLGTEPLDEKGWALSNIAALLDARYDSGRKTIVTSNLPWDRLRLRYGGADGGRLVDRVREAGAVIELDGESMRRAAVPLHWSEPREPGEDDT